LSTYQGGGYAVGSYIDPTDAGAKDIGKYRDDFYQRMYTSNSALWQQGSIDARFKAGDTSLINYLYGDENGSKLRRCSFNLIRRHVDMICGYQRKNRKSTIAVPLFQGDELADDYNAVLKWSEARDGSHEYLSQAFEGAVTSGISLLTLNLDYNSDPVSGDFLVDHVAYNNFLIDMNFRKQSLEDCEAIWIRNWITPEELKSAVPNAAEDKVAYGYRGSKDAKFPLQAEAMNVDITKLIPVDYFYYHCTREATMVYDKFSGEMVEFKPEEDENEDTLSYIMQANPWLTIKKRQVPTVKLAISIGNKTYYNGPNQLNIDRFPMAVCLCYHDPDMQSYAWRFSGKVRSLRDPQWLYDTQKIIELDILRSQINSGWVYPVDALVDPKALRQKGQGFLIPVKAGHSAEEIKRIDPPAIPQTVLELSRALADDITKISGVNEELLGAASDDASGILSMLRQGAGLTTLQTIFDKIDYSQRLFGEIKLEAIRANFSKTKVRKILGRDPARGFFNPSTLKYSIAVEEGNYTTTQRQMELQQLLHFKQIGIPVPDSAILSVAFITNKKELIEQMQQEKAQEAQQMQMQAQAQAQETQSKVMESYARAKLDLAAASEKMSKIDENEASAEHKREEADLALVKELMLLEGMELDQTQKAMGIASLVKFQNEEMNQQKNQNPIM
jgi:hypothetical protein